MNNGKKKKKNVEMGVMGRPAVVPWWYGGVVVMIGECLGGRVVVWSVCVRYKKRKREEKVYIIGEK
jgi:uncharacterized protein (DUF2062 family)